MKISTQIGNVGINLDTSKMEHRIKVNAQRALDEDVLNDTQPYVPFRSGFLQGSGHIADGGGEVVWGAVYSHFQYIGFVRTDENGRVFVGKHEEKPILTERPLQYGHHGATSRWFEESKKENLQKWIDTVKKEIGKG